MRGCVCVRAICVHLTAAAHSYAAERDEILASLKRRAVRVVAALRDLEGARPCAAVAAARIAPGRVRRVCDWC